MSRRCPLQLKEEEEKEEEEEEEEGARVHLLLHHRRVNTRSAPLKGRILMEPLVSKG